MRDEYQQCGGVLSVMTCVSRHDTCFPHPFNRAFSYHTYRLVSSFGTGIPLSNTHAHTHARLGSKSNPTTPPECVGTVLSRSMDVRCCVCVGKISRNEITHTFLHRRRRLIDGSSDRYLYLCVCITHQPPTTSVQIDDFDDDVL